MNLRNQLRNIFEEKTVIPTIGYHISNSKFDTFDPYFTAQHIIWFSTDKNDLIKNMHGASINNKKPIYLYTVELHIKNPAGWDAYDKYSSDELLNKKYDAIILDDDIAVLDENIIKNIKRTLVNNIQESSKIPFSQLSSVREFVKLTSPEAVQRELQGAENASENEVDNYVTQRVQQIQSERKLKSKIESEPEIVGNYYRAIPGKWNNKNIKLNTLSNGKYYLHVAPTASDAKKWVPILLRDEYINPGVVSIIKIDVGGLKELDSALQVEDDDHIADKTNTPDANKIVTTLPTIDKKFISLIDTFKISQKDSAQDLFESSTIQTEEFKKWFNGSKAVNSDGTPMILYHGTASAEHFTVFSVDGVPYVEDDDAEENFDAGSGGEPNTFMGAHFAQEPEVASKFANLDFDWLKKRKNLKGRNSSPRVYPVFLKIKNPKVYSSEDILNDFIFSQNANSEYVEFVMEIIANNGEQEYDDINDEYDSNEQTRITINQQAMEYVANMDSGGYDYTNHAAEFARELGQSAKEELIKHGHDGIKYKNDIEGGISWIAFFPNQIKSALGSKFSDNPDIKLEEDLSPKKPTSKITKRNIIKQQGTIRAHKVIQYQFTTENGNNVKVHVKPDGENSYDILFYVNDNMYDDSSSKNSESGRDKEILNGVLYVIQHVIKYLKPERITFEAISSDGDSKQVKNIDITKPKIELLKAIKMVKEQLEQYEATIVQPSKMRLELSQMSGKPLQTLYDINKSEYIELLNSLINSIQTDNQNLFGLEWDLQTKIHNDKSWKNIYNSKIDPNEILLNKLNLYTTAVKSNKPEGTIIQTNRRANVYERLLNKYFANEWDIKKNGDFFEMTKK
jgi:hypothetical protein